MDLKLLAEPFPPDDIEWRISRSGMSKAGKPFAWVLAYITARAIAKRLDDVCGPENWSNTQQQIKELRPGQFSVQVGISIRIGDDWITKYDVAEPTGIEPAKGGFSGAMKRAGAQWGIGRYLYSLDETFANTTTNEDAGKGWEYARLSKDNGGASFYWQRPRLPSWALPSDKDDELEKPVTDTEINALKRKWKAKFASKERDKEKLSDAWRNFVFQKSGEFPIDDAERWTQHTAKIVHDLIERSSPNHSGPSADVPFGK